MSTFFFFLAIPNSSLTWVGFDLGWREIGVGDVDAASSQPTIPTNTTEICPLDFNILGRLAEGSRPSDKVADQCLFILQGLRLVQSDYLRRTNSFLPPFSSSDSCWKDYQNIIDQFPNSFDILTTCGFQTQWIGQGCENITTRSQFENRNSNASLNSVVQACNQSLHGEPCATCTTSIYAAAFAYPFGPTDKDTAECLFALNLDSSKSNKKHSTALIFVYNSERHENTKRDAEVLIHLVKD
ncbi:hypothetical protein AG4045_018330 [Apium graveolens]|uniref:SPARK domain-containing protein n=1 Tax=Apium graveolens TaxID=4045 RepID=A0A6L5B9Y0_APIGR|nr:hypothetical protein AG4045_018330 [Apium graveolens]